MNAVDNVRTSPPVLELLHASIVLWTPLMNLANSSVEHLVGIVEDPYWRSGGSVLNLLRCLWPAVLVELSAPKIIPQIMTTIMMKSGPWKLQRATSYIYTLKVSISKPTRAAVMTL